MYGYVITEIVKGYIAHDVSTANDLNQKQNSRYYFFPSGHGNESYNLVGS